MNGKERKLILASEVSCQYDRASHSWKSQESVLNALCSDLAISKEIIRFKDSELKEADADDMVFVEESK